MAAAVHEHVVVDVVVRGAVLLLVDCHVPRYHGYHPWQPDRVQGV